MPFQFLQNFLSLFRRSAPPVPLPRSLRPLRKPVDGWRASALLDFKEAVACSKFYLRTIWHWERVGDLKHEGLTCEFVRDDLATVYIKFERISYDNDPYSSSVDAFNLLGRPRITESLDQNSERSLFKAQDWVQVLDRKERAMYFRPSLPNNKFIKHLGTTIFTHEQVSVPPPTVVDVMLVVNAVADARTEYGIWQANCWWLTRSIRMFIESRWNRNPELPEPDAVIVGFDTGIARIMEDQPIIERNYRVEDARRDGLMNYEENLARALRRLGEAERRIREARETRIATQPADLAVWESLERDACIAEQKACIAEREAHHRGASC